MYQNIKVISTLYQDYINIISTYKKIDCKYNKVILFIIKSRMTTSFLIICIFIVSVLTRHICFGETHAPITISEFLKKCNKTIYIFSERDTNINCNACLRAKTIKKQKQNNDNTVDIDTAKPVPIQQETKKPITNLRNGDYSNPLMKNNLRGTPYTQGFATYNPANRYCYSILHTIKHIVGV